MNSLFTPYFVGQLIRETGPAVPQEVQQLTDRFGTQTQLILADFAYHALLITGLMAAISLLIASLLLVLHNPLTKIAQPDIRLIRRASVNQPPKHPPESRIARANRHELRVVSARIQAGQLSN